MEKGPLSRDSLRTLARGSGLDLSDEALDELLPLVQQTLEATEDLGALDLGSVEPAVTFKPMGE